MHAFQFIPAWDAGLLFVAAGHSHPALGVQTGSQAAHSLAEVSVRPEVCTILTTGLDLVGGQPSKLVQGPMGCCTAGLLFDAQWGQRCNNVCGRVPAHSAKALTFSVRLDLRVARMLYSFRARICSPLTTPAKPYAAPFLRARTAIRQDSNIWLVWDPSQGMSPMFMIDIECPQRCSIDHLLVHTQPTSPQATWQHIVPAFQMLSLMVVTGP